MYLPHSIPSLIKYYGVTCILVFYHDICWPCDKHFAFLIKFAITLESYLFKKVLLVSENWKSRSKTLSLSNWPGK